MAGATRTILAIAWVAVTGLVSLQSELVSPPAQAQDSENFSANTCLSGREVVGGYTYDNTCDQPITLKSCALTPAQDCKQEAHFATSQIAAYGSTTVNVPSGATSIQARACKAGGEHFWLKADAYFGLEGRYACRANAATSALIAFADNNFGPYEAGVWRARPVQLSSPSTAMCTAVINHGAMGLDADGSRFIKERYGSGPVTQMRWSGACDANGLISGAGTLSFKVIGRVDSIPEKAFIGTADRGLLVGRAGYNRSNGSGEPPEPIFFDNGCNNWYGARPNTCDPAAGVSMRQRFLASSPALAASPATNPVSRSVEPFRDCSDCPQMVSIPAGSFMMGSPESEAGRSINEGPQRRVTVPAFGVGKYEVTWAEWNRCVAAGACTRPASDEFGGGTRPVTNVSWDDAVAYTKWLSNKTRQTYRLLSEAEWEYVARAGTTTPFSFGSTISAKLANYDSGGTTPVGTFPANAFGLHDLHGNVEEFVQDCETDRYSSAQPTDGSAYHLAACSVHIARGGTWADYAPSLRSAARRGVDLYGWDNGIGFRVARTNP